MIKKVLFINAIDESSKLQSYLPPLGLASLAASIRKEYGETIECKIIDRDIAATLKEYRPDLVGITAVSENYNRAKQAAKLAKASGARVVVGGQHVTALPQTITDDMDCVVIGEGEWAIIDLIRHYNRDDTLNPLNLVKIQGIAFKQQTGALWKTDPRRNIETLDDLPLPARDLLPQTDRANIFTSRGCPYRCPFCASSRFWRALRLFSADYVLKEIQTLVDAGARYIEIWDDLFIADKPRLREIAYKIHQAGIDKTVQFSCNARANLMDGEVASLLRLMNVDIIWMGLESGNDRILHYLKPEGATVTQNAFAVQLIKNHGMKVCGSFIYGTPSETKADVQDTIKFIKQNKMHSFTVHLLVPLPGTPIWDYARKHSLVNDNMDWDRLRMTTEKNFDNAVILSETMTRKELKDLYNQFAYLVNDITVRRILSNPTAISIPGAIRAAGRVLTGKPPFKV